MENEDTNFDHDPEVEELRDAEELAEKQKMDDHNNHEEMPEKKEKSKKWWYILGGCLGCGVLIGIIVVAAGFLGGRRLFQEIDNIESQIEDDEAALGNYLNAVNESEDILKDINASLSNTNSTNETNTNASTEDEVLPDAKAELGETNDAGAFIAKKTFRADTKTITINAFVENGKTTTSITAQILDPTGVVAYTESLVAGNNSKVSFTFKPSETLISGPYSYSIYVDNEPVDNGGFTVEPVQSSSSQPPENTETPSNTNSTESNTNTTNTTDEAKTESSSSSDTPPETSTTPDSTNTSS